MIDSKQLVTFQNNSGQRDAVREFMVGVLEEIAIERAFAGETVEGIPEARKLVDRMFDKLDELYGQEVKPIIRNSR